jgi:two-component system NtrC family sensor kinase
VTGQSELEQVQHTENRKANGSPLNSLRSKAWFFTLILAIYFLVVSIVVGIERQGLFESVEQLQELNEIEERLVGVNYAVSRSVISINENYFSTDMDTSGKMLALELEALNPGLTRLQGHFPQLFEIRRSLEQFSVELALGPSRATIADLRGEMHRLVIELDSVTTSVSQSKSRMVRRYEATFVRLTHEWLAFGVVALCLIAWVFSVFFRGLSVDIERVREHATALVQGKEVSKLEHGRKDELGMLMDAVNAMQDQLSVRDSEIELARQQIFHKEKMAAIGSLAASVAHEINNPLSAIVGVAQAINDECNVSKCDNYGASCHPMLILDQAKRVIQITRQLSEFSVPQSQDPEYVDVNGLLRSTTSFVKFDRRFRLIDIVLDLDNGLPAVYLIADHLVQVVMNLLINAADAMQGIDRPSLQIRVVTATQSDGVVIRIIDNGTGISPENLPRVFVERFTTKGVGHGSGLGLYLCRSLIEKAGGGLEIISEFGAGTESLVRLPIPMFGSDIG